jgi:hypothetical protein
MTAGRAAALGSLEYEAESSFSEISTSFGTRLPVLQELDFSGLKQTKIPTEFLMQKLQEGEKHVIGTWSGTFVTTFYIPGHGSATSGAMSASALETLWSFVFGIMTVGGSGTTVSGGTAAAPETAAANGLPPGGLCRVGARNDGRGNGAWAAIGDHETNTLTLLTALDDAPDAADVVYSAVNFCLPEDANDAAAVPSSIRLRATTAGLQYVMHGCVATNMSITGGNAGELLKIEITWDVARADKATSGTYPSAASVTRKLPAPTAGGGMFVAPVGTSTRNDTTKRRVRNFTIEIQLGLERIETNDAANEYQTTTQWVRTPSTITLRWDELADDAETLSPYLDGLWEADATYHVLYEPNRTPTKAVAFYARNCCVVGDRPMPKREGDVWWVPIEMRAYTGTVTTSQLTQAALVMAVS